MVKALKIFLFILAFVIIGEVVYFTAFKSKTTSVQKTSMSNEVQDSVDRILYQEKNDTEGRSVIYRKKDFSYSGIGEFYNTATSPAKLVQIIGVFKGWESIPNSKDRYILLENPLDEKPVQKTRVSFEASALFDKGMNSTVLAVENLKTGIIENAKIQIRNLSPDQIDFFLKRGDAVVITPLIQEDSSIRRDGQGIICAAWIILRRNSGISQMNL